MEIKKELNEALRDIFHATTDRPLGNADFTRACEILQVARLRYDMDLGGEKRYRDPRTGELVLQVREEDGKIILYEDGSEPGEMLVYPYYYEGMEFCHAYVDLKQGVSAASLDAELYQYMADIVYVVVSRQNMRFMLDFSERADAQTGIPNAVYIRAKYHRMIEKIPPDRYAVLYINLQNFKYLNEVGGAKCGDEGIIQYAEKVMHFVDPEECVCRMGGDNFVMFVKKEHLDYVIERLSSVVLKQLPHAPARVFEISAWIGMSVLADGEVKPFGARVEEAATACNLGKTRLKQKVTAYTGEMAKMLNRSREIIAMFHPAVAKHEIQPFFQAKVNMETGEVIGFEALSRWIHEGRFIYPDQFIPALEREGMMHDLDMTILRETCSSIRLWKDKGLVTPRISVNCSRKNLFVDGIEDEICGVIRENGLEPDDIEIEITESAKEIEHDRLIEFVNNLKQQGLRVAIDDFGTGYSSLSLIHNINADVIKIDKSFVDEILTNHKAEILIESIINIAKRLKMEVIAEGVETAEQGALLKKLGCVNAQGYYYSKPADYATTTEIIANPPYQPIPA